MADRRVTKTRKDNDGDITALCNPDAWWLTVDAATVIAEIEAETHRYYVKVGETEVDIHVVKGVSGKYLRTDPDNSEGNNLDELPDC